MKVTTADMAKGTFAAAMLASCMFSGNANAEEWNIDAGAGIAESPAVNGISFDDGNALSLGIRRSLGDHFDVGVRATRLATDLPYGMGNATLAAYDATIEAHVPVMGLQVYGGVGYTYANANAQSTFGGLDGSGDGRVLYAGFRAPIGNRLTAGVEYADYDVDVDLGFDANVTTGVLQGKIAYKFG